jgi:hypothetical protein
MLRNTCLCLLLFFTATLQAQVYTLKGKITNNRLEPLAYATVQVQELQRGTTTKENGTFELLLEEGKYTVVFSMVGYTSRSVTVAFPVTRCLTLYWRKKQAG